MTAIAPITAPITGPITYDSRDAWLEARRSKITGTDAARIIGLSSFGGPMDVYLEKLGLANDRPMSEWQDAGRRFERPIIEWYADRHGVPVTFNPPHTLTPSPTSRIIAVTLDAQRTDITPHPPVDAKNIRYADEKWGEDGTDQMPLYYATQLVLQTHATGADFADLPVVFSGQELCTYTLHRDLNLEAEIVGRCERFWEDHILREIPPPVDGSASYTQYLQEYIKQRTEAVIPATAELHETAIKLQAVKDQIALLEPEEELLKNLLKSAIGEAKALVGATWKANWTQAKDSMKTDWQTVAQDMNSSACLLADLLDDPIRRLQLIDEPDVLAALISDLRQLYKRHTSTRTAKVPGSRRFTFNFKGH